MNSGSIPTRPEADRFAASAAQQRLWFLQHRHPASRAYTVTEAIWLRGPLDAEALERSLAALVERHAQLRVVFDYRDGGLWQRVLPAGAHPVELRRATVDRDEVDAWLGRQAEEGFDLRTGPLFRAVLAELGPDERVFAFLVHHIVTDGWASQVFFAELGAAYQAELAGTRPEWTEPAGDYRAAVDRERARLAAPEFDTRVASAAEPVRSASFGIDLPRDAAATEPAQAGTLRERLPDDLVKGAETVAAAHGATQAMFYAASFAALLARHSGQEQVVIGLPVAGRDPEAASCYGLFVNTIPLPVTVRGDDSWSDLLASVRDAAVVAYSHADVPLDRLAAHLGGAPLAAMLVVQPDDEPLPELTGVRAARYFPMNRHTKFDVVLQLDRALAVAPGGSEPESGLWAALEYPAESWTRARAERLLAHWRLVVAAMSADPAARVADLDLVTPAEQELRAGGRRLAEAVPALDPVEGFARVVTEQPEAPAVWQDGRVLSYAGLAARVGAIQSALLDAGIAPGDSVGVCLRRTPDLVAALHAILRSGATYVPLDPAYPRERLAFIADDADCALILVEPDTREVLPGGGTPTLDTAALADADLPAAAPTDPEHVAYLIYTSGSTGRPKGVAIPHRAMRAFLGWARAHFPADEGAVVLASTSVCFDLSVFELFLPLSLGGSVRLVGTALELAERPDPAPTLINTVPSAMAELLRADALPARTRVVNLAGEALPRALVDLVHAASPSVRVFNLYGPSEDTTYSTWCEVPRGSAEEPTIGFPVEGTNAYVLDAALAPVPVGVDGELFLGGLGVAQGYLGRPELTAERFLPDPFTTEPGARMYRTGDRVRLTDTGELRYLGRYDHQVKLRGFRIETGEIESRAAELDGVDQAVVTVRTVAGTDHLVCYWTGGADADALRAALAEALPEYMVPRYWVPLKAFPLNPNGKTDRAALPEPARDTGGSTAPATDTERALAELVAELTASGPLGADAEFFELGGHSLMAMQLVVVVRERLGAEITLADVFADRTVRALAERVDRATANQIVLPPLRPRSGAGPAPLAYAQERMWLVDQLRPGTAMLNIGMAVRFTGDLDRDLLRRALQGLTDRHDALRLRVGRGPDGKLRQQAVANQTVAPQVLASAGEKATDRLLRSAVATPFDVATEPPARWVLVNEPGAAVLCLVIHHVVADAPSLRVLFDELLADYAALRERAPLTQAPAVSVLDYGEWQRHALDHSIAVRRDLAYWRERLADLPDRLRLAFDRDPAAATAFSGSRVTRKLPDAAVDALLAVGRSAGATPFAALLAAYQGLMGRLSGQDDIVVGTPIADRDQSGTERLVGCLLNTLALRADLSGALSYAELLAQTRQRCLEAFAHQQTPFELVVGALDVERAVDHTPVFQTMFVLHGDQQPLPAPAGLGCSVVEVEPVATQFDVTVMVSRDERGWVAEWDYRTDLFDAATVERFADCFAAMIAAAAREPALPLTHLRLGQTELPASGRPAATPVPATLPELFAAHAHRDEPAVRDDDGTLTYRELDAAANRLARRLAGRGVGQDDLVAIVLPRTRAAVTAVLGVAKAGAAFLCLDPALPAERMAWIARDAGVRLQITDASLAGRLDAVPELRLDGERPGEPVADPDLHRLTTDHLCYAIYTSGSTGTPKGVLLPHSGLAQLRDLHRDRFDAGPGSHVLQYAPHSFDAWVWECAMALLTGACLHMTAADALLPGGPLESALAARGITHLTMPPSNLAMVTALPDSLRHLVLAGEALPADLVTRWGGRVHMWNAYGPSEATVCGTIRDCTDLPAGQAPTIGTAFAGAQAYVLDEALNPVPAGVPGELCLGGQGLGRGYLGRPELTASVFVPHPDPARPGERLYRTGDRARLTADGEIEFLGRADDQVKLRGIRVELGEIERALAAGPRVGGAVVLIAGTGGEQHLVGFVTGPADLDVEELRGQLTTTLPAYMVPAWVDRLEAFPLTGNGKLDRRALAARAATRRPVRRASAPPRGPVETEITAIWRELLPDAEIGREDSFFALGGTSLTLTRLHERLDARYRGALKLVDLFRLTTVAAIATALENTGAVEPAASADLSFRL
ncbi:amino acid adenylation domain-containing protein [Kibdelosporangium philippinense]|uniref:amino acid adenylation domain-containing protein n=1 Tax=Kibdelosporangium philippinense TaxID=211113 RepID=UPI0035EC03D7